MEAILLKTMVPIKSKLFPALIVHVKMDEFSGVRLYNHANDTYNSFYYVDSEAITWHSYLETLPPTANSLAPIKFMFCNKENYT